MGKKLILVIDDDRASRKLATDLLHVAGYIVVTANTGAHGIALANVRRPDLILMDIRLPDTDGVAAMKAIKTDPKTNNVPIIAVTAYAMRGDKEHLLEQGFDDFLAKPLDIHVLLNRVRHHLHEEG